MSQVTRRSLLLALPLLALASPAIAQEGQRSGWEFGFRGILLMNAFHNDANVNTDDVPTFAIVSTRGPNPERTLGSSLRQTRVVATADLADFGGGTLHAELDADFFGAQSAATRTGPALRLRRMIGEARWDRFSLLVGQESPLVADINPASLAALGLPGFAASGNLWLWIPQVRAGFDLNGGDGVILGVDLAALSPTPPEGQPTGATMPTTAEMSGRPMLEGRVRARWGDGAEFGVGAHQGWHSTTGDSLLTSNAVVVGAILPLGRSLELRGEWYSGKGTSILGGGAIGQALNGDGAPMKSTGGWAQLNVRAGQRWEFGAGYGYDDAEGTAADEAASAFRDKNTSYSSRLQWRMTPAVVAFEYRHFATVFGGGNGERTASHLNLAMGVEF